MQAETEHILERVKQTKNVTNHRGKITKRQTRILPHRERRERETEKKWIDDVLNQPPWAMKDVSGEGRAALVRRRNRLEDEAAEYYPPTDLTGSTRDALAKYAEELKSEWREGMPTAETMRRNPAGAVDMHMKWEAKNKEKIIQWKNCMRLLEPENEDKDFTNIERFRPSGLSPDAAASFMMGAQIPGHFAMTPLAKANWPENMPQYGTADTAMKQVERREMVEDMVERGLVEPEPDRIAALEETIKKLQAQLSTKAIVETQTRKRGRRGWTPEQRQAARERTMARLQAKQTETGE